MIKLFFFLSNATLFILVYIERLQSRKFFKCVQ